MDFSGVIYTDAIGDSPAAVNLHTGELHINPEVFFSYPPLWQKFIVLHELGHYQLQTRSEEMADQFAFHHFAQEGHSLKEACYALLKVLDPEHPPHKERIDAQIERAKFWDQQVYGKQFKNKEQRQQAMSQYITSQTDALAYCLGKKQVGKAKKHMANILVVAPPKIQEQLLDKFADMLADIKPDRQSDELEYFLCGKKCQERKDKKAEARAELIKARAEAKVNKSEANLSLADQGIKKTGASDFINSVGGALGNLFGRGGQQQPLVNPNDQGRFDFNAQVGTTDPNAGNNTGLYVGIGVVVLVIIAVAVYLLMKKKKKG